MTFEPIVRYAVRDRLTGKFVSVWESKSLYHEWTNDPTKIRSFKRLEDAVKLATKLPNTQAVELSSTVTVTPVPVDNRIRIALDAKVEDAKKTVAELNRVDERLWSGPQDHKFRKARKLLTDNGIDWKTL